MASRRSRESGTKLVPADNPCAYCEKIFEVEPCRRSVAKYCSYSCSGKGRGKQKVGKPLSEEHKKSISDGRIGMTFTDEHRENIALARCGVMLSEETKEKLSQMRKESCNTPEWRKKMSEQSTAIWKDPVIRETILSHQQIHFDSTERGNNFPIGTPQTQLDFAPILQSVGYEMEVVVVTGQGHGHHYTLDFAHREAKVAIEIDGSSHLSKIDHDNNRDITLRKLGWKIIRIKV